MLWSWGLEVPHAHQAAQQSVQLQSQLLLDNGSCLRSPLGKLLGFQAWAPVPSGQAKMILQAELWSPDTYLD